MDSDPKVSAGSPLLAYTQTSVMRKTAAERKDSDPKVSASSPLLVYTQTSVMRIAEDSHGKEGFRP